MLQSEVFIVELATIDRSPTGSVLVCEIPALTHEACEKSRPCYELIILTWKSTYRVRDLHLEFQHDKNTVASIITRNYSMEDRILKSEALLMCTESSKVLHGLRHDVLVQQHTNASCTLSSDRNVEVYLRQHTVLVICHGKRLRLELNFWVDPRLRTCTFAELSFSCAAAASSMLRLLPDPLPVAVAEAS